MPPAAAAAASSSSPSGLNIASLPKVGATPLSATQTLRPMTAGSSRDELFGFGQHHTIARVHYTYIGPVHSQYTNDYHSPHRHHHANGLYKRRTGLDDLRRELEGPLSITPRAANIGPRSRRAATGIHTRERKQFRFEYDRLHPRSDAPRLKPNRSQGTIVLPPPKSPSSPGSPSGRSSPSSRPGSPGFEAKLVDALGYVG